MKKALIPISVGLLVVCGVGGLAFRRMAGAAGPPSTAVTTKVERGDLAVTVVETGSVDAAKAVEVKSRVSGRLAKLLVDEGDQVTQGQLIAVIDPQETELVVRQNAAQLRGAQSAVGKASLEIGQRRLTAKAAYDQAVARLQQLEMEVVAQPKLTNAAIRSAQTSLATALAEKNRLVQSAHPTQRTTAESSVREAQANFDNAQSEYTRQAGLEEKGYVAGRQVESAKLALDLARVRLESAKENQAKLDAQLRAELSKADEQIRQAQAELTRNQVNRFQDKVKITEVASARAEVAKAKAALSDVAIMAKGQEQQRATVDQLGSVLTDAERQLRETQVRAPMSGVVTRKLLEVGELATGLSGFSQGTPIVRIEDRRTMKVKLDINEIDVAKLEVGMPAKVEVDALPNEKLFGTVAKIAPTNVASASGAASADAVVRYQVEIRLNNLAQKLRTGMSAKCTMDVAKRTGVLVLPMEFAQKEGADYFVNVQIPGSKPPKTERKRIQVGLATGAKIEVVGGLKAGDVVQKSKFNGPERKGMMGGPGDD